MKCDIITPTYNRPKLLQRAIKSVLAQTSPNWEKSTALIRKKWKGHRNPIIKKFIVDITRGK